MRRLWRPQLHNMNWVNIPSTCFFNTSDRHFGIRNSHPGPGRRPVDNVAWCSRAPRRRSRRGRAPSSSALWWSWGWRWPRRWWCLGMGTGLQGGGCKESPAMCWLKCHEMSIDYIVEFDGLCMFMDVYVRYGFTIGHGGFWWFHGQISEVHHSPPRPPPSKAQVQKHWSSQLLEKMLGVYGRWIWYTWGYTLWLFNIAMV